MLRDLPTVLAHPITIVADTSAALLALPGRLVGLVTSAGQTLAAAHAAVTRTEALFDRVDSVAGRADGVVHDASRTTTAAAVAVEQAGTLTASAAPLLASYSKPLHRLKPTVRRLAETIEPHVLRQPRRGDQARTDRLIPSAGSGT